MSSDLTELGQKAIAAVSRGVADGAPLVKCQLLASAFYEALRHELRKADAAKRITLLAVTHQCHQSAAANIALEKHVQISRLQMLDLIAPQMGRRTPGCMGEAVYLQEGRRPNEELLFSRAQLSPGQVCGFPSPHPDQGLIHLLTNGAHCGGGEGVSPKKSLIKIGEPITAQSRCSSRSFHVDGLGIHALEAFSRSRLECSHATN
jgi:hypothetical protein